MQSARFLILLVLLDIFLIQDNKLLGQCASGIITLSGFTSDGGAGTYADPATGKITINYCFTLQKFTELNTNWVHGIFISWDDLPKGAIVMEGPTGSQPTQHGNRFWTFIDSTTAKVHNLPGPGFYVDEGDYNPKNNYGDNGLGTPKATFPDLDPFCFIIKVDCANSQPTAFVPKVTVTGDGTTGAWTNSACSGDLIRSINDGPNGNGTIVICGTVLPVKLLEFSGEATKQGNLLKWIAVADDLFSHFELESAQANKSQFFNLGRIEPVKGNAGNEIHEYSFLDSKPALLSLYRLKMIERDGSFVYSKIISIRQQNGIAANSKFSLLPNPASDFIIIHNETDSNYGDIEISIYDLFGKQILKSDFVSDKSAKDFLMEVSGMAKGMYFLEVYSGNQSLEKLNFIKQ